MEGTLERECGGGLGGLFHQIIADMKNGTPLWEDLVTKATKLHSCLRVAIQAIATYLDAFQKIADAATNARGATKEIGTALTRICLRHKAVEARMKTFTSAIMDCLVVPLQEKIEDWKKSVVILDKEHSKEYKRARTELKKRSTDTLRLQKKARKGTAGKGSDLQRRVEYSMQDITERRQHLEETEKQAVRAALVEERSRFCLFVSFLKPVVDEEIAMLSELTHLQDAVEALEKHAQDPRGMPAASEQVITDVRYKQGDAASQWQFNTPPSSPSSLGSRKSSMCSISSLNSSSSGSSKSHRSLSQPVGRHPLRLVSLSSRDSGFTSQDTLYSRPISENSVQTQVSNISEHSSGTINAALPNSTATWPNLQETLQFERAASAIISDRPHTISSAYEKGHQRTPLTVYTFQAPDQSHSQPASPTNGQTAPPSSPRSIQKSNQAIYSKPPLPTRCSSLERPNIPAKSIHGMSPFRVLPVGNIEHKLLTKPTPLPAHIAKDVPQPTYVNMHELANLAASKAQEMNLPPPPPEFNSAPTTAVAEKPTPAATPGEGEKDGSTSESSLESSSGYGSQTTFPVEDPSHGEDVLTCSLETASKYCTLPRNNDPMVMQRRRPLSMSALYSSNTMRNALLRRGSVQGARPPPPVRRTASISSAARGLSPVGSLEHLPPPPAFLLDGNAAGQTSPSTTPQQNTSAQIRHGVNVAETVKALTELKHTPASPGAARRSAGPPQQTSTTVVTPTTQQKSTPGLTTFAPQGSVQNIHQLASFQLQQPQQQTKNTIYAQPNQVIRINTSPNSIRRVPSTRSQSAERQSVTPGGVGQSFIAALSAKLAPSLSPRNSRRHSEDLGPSTNTFGHRQQLKGPGQGFLDTLNAKLAQQHLNSQGQQHKAVKVRQLINSRVQPDPTVYHESLMDQIKKGATLKKAARVNDRSAPKIR